MQKKFGTILDENLLKLAKQKAQQQKTTLNHIRTLLKMANFDDKRRWSIS